MKKQNPEMHLPNREKHSITESESYEVGSEEVEVVAKNNLPQREERENCNDDDDDDDVNKKPNTQKKLEFYVVVVEVFFFLLCL